ncbi:MAG: LysR family transcriptional regulator [Dehalococcoidia bacterium]|nr:LysR family transcriptional regulator [Dehalococcoidia bacterium]
MQALERALGETLFERSTRSVRLTEAGRLFLRACNKTHSSGRMALHWPARHWLASKPIPP